MNDTFYSDLDIASGFLRHAFREGAEVEIHLGSHVTLRGASSRLRRELAVARDRLLVLGETMIVRDRVHHEQLLAPLRYAIYDDAGEVAGAFTVVATQQAHGVPLLRQLRTHALWDWRLLSGTVAER